MSIVVDIVRESGQRPIWTYDLGRNSMEYLKKEIAHNQIVYYRIEGSEGDFGDWEWMLTDVQLK